MQHSTSLVLEMIASMCIDCESKVQNQ
jgi:hypothetical protein